MATKLYLIILFLLFQVWGYAQKVEDITFAMDGDLVRINYTLIGDFPEQTFEVKVYTSFDKFEKPLEQIQGDVNKKNIKPGKKEAVWDAKKEYKLFEGDISFKIVATVISNYWITAPTKGEVLKRGKEYEIIWEGFKPGTSVKITLNYASGGFDEVTSYATGKSYVWKVKGKPGKGAYLKVADMDNINASAKSGAFTLKRKIPLGAQLGTTALIAGGVVFYLLQPTVLDPLPVPPDPVK